MNTVITPNALERSRFVKMPLSHLPRMAGGVAHVFVFPSQDPVNEVNGDGELLEITGWCEDFSCVTTECKTVATTPDTTIYVR